MGKNEMGCGTSSSTSTAEDDVPQQQRQHRTTNGSMPIATISSTIDAKSIKPAETMVEAFKRLDEDICRMESSCIGPRLTTTEAWIEHLESTMSPLVPVDVMVMPDNEDPKLITDDNTLFANAPDDIEAGDRDESVKVRHLAVKLGIAFNVNNAAKQEEFLAKISKSHMMLEHKMFRSDILNHAKMRANTLLIQYNQLRSMYVEEDNLIISITGGTYNSELEQMLDAELESLREVRDNLGGVAEQWRTSGTFLRACAKSALQAYEFWSLAGPSKNAAERVSLALDCRTACHGSLATLEGAQTALPQVEIPFISLRQASAVKHAITYLLTDMANDARYRHTKDVLEVFQLNATKAVEWLHNKYSSTLKKDLDEANNNVHGIATKLRKERLRYMYEKVGDKIYTRRPSGVN